MADTPAREPTRLYQEGIPLPMAGLGRLNPLAPLRGPQEIHKVENPAELPPEMRAGIAYGFLHSTLPCLDQDGYDRNRQPGTVSAVVLRNQHLRAIVLPGLGGRLYALIDEHTGRDLLFRNPVCQPANLALRNAWFAGGVEWNLGSTGHWTLTCEPLHAAEVTAPDGTPALRLWEWERTRNLVLQLDFWLPADSRQLLVAVRVRNPNDFEVPAYWWSNIAVPQTPGTRVLVPAERAWHYGYDARFRLLTVASHDDGDLTYPMSHQQAADFFFELADGQRPWIAALDESGTGLAHTSTARLRGRKLFVWGEHTGGHRWQQWLSPGTDGHGYAEIQAGLARTQLEHVPMPAHASWGWVESYGLVQAPAEHVHNPDWSAAWRAVDGVVEELLPRHELDRRHAEWLEIADDEPQARLAIGSGWGALELRRMHRSATTASLLPGTPFGSETMTAEQRPWLALLEGAMPATDPLEPPGGTLVTAQWQALLDVAAPNWFVEYHRGVSRWYAGDTTGAVAAWHRSIEAAESPWALRGLAVAAMAHGDAQEVLAWYRRALTLLPDEPALAVEALESLLELGLSGEAANLLDLLTAPVNRHPRVRLAWVRILLASDRPAEAAALLEAGIVLPDIREGANHLTELWHAAQERLGTARPLPSHYDFGMS